MCKTIIFSNAYFHRYFRLKYEDLLTHPGSSLAKLFHNLNLEFDFDVVDSIFNHTREIDSSDIYFSTYR